MCNIIGICWFCKSVANCYKWLTYRGGQLQRFAVIDVRCSVDFHSLSFQYLEELKNKKVRIVIGDMFDEVLRDVMCQAYHLKMTAQEGYVWFLPLWLAPSWYDTDHYNAHHSENVPCSTAQMVDVSSFLYSA